MISVLIFAFPATGFVAASPGEAVRTLSSLVPAVVEGIARDVALVASPPSEDLAHVADHAGCALIEADVPVAAIEAAARQCRASDVLVIRAGVMIDRSFLDEMSRILPVVALASRPAAYIIKASGTAGPGQVFAALAPTVGVLTKRDAIVASRPGHLKALVRASRPARLFRQRAWAGH